MTTSQQPIPSGGMNASWGKLSSPLQKAFAYAEQQAAQEGSEQVSDQQLLEGLLKLTSAESNGVRLIEQQGVSPDSILAYLPAQGAATIWPPQPIVERNPRGPNESRKVSAACIALINLTGEVADKMGHDHIGTEHLVIAMLTMPDTVSHAALTRYGLTLDQSQERLSRWMMRGEYVREPVAKAQSVPSGSGAGTLRATILTARQWASVIYTVVVISTWLGGSFIPMPLGYWLRVFSALTYYPLIIFFIPYILSTYALSNLLKTRAVRGLNAARPSESMRGLGSAFAISAVLGVCLAISILPMLASVAGMQIGPVSVGALPIMLVIARWIFLVNCCVLAVTHWLLTLNVR